MWVTFMGNEQRWNFQLYSHVCVWTHWLCRNEMKANVLFFIIFMSQTISVFCQPREGEKQKKKNSISVGSLCKSKGIWMWLALNVWSWNVRILSPTDVLQMEGCRFNVTVSSSVQPACLDSYCISIKENCLPHEVSLEISKAFHRWLHLKEQNS